MVPGGALQQALSGRTILITGAAGMLGRAFQEALATDGVRCRTIALDREALDVTNRDAVLAQAALDPDIIVHCAANVDADDCERDADGCRRVQVGGTRNIVDLALATGARLFYPQSVFIFDGRQLPVTEETVPAPTFAYGRCKWEAEQIVRSTMPDALIVRMAGFFGGDEKDKNFVGKFTRALRQLLSAGDRRYVVGMRMWQPTYTLDLARNTLLLFARGCTGIYHMGARGEATFYDVARACVQSLGLADRIEIAPGDPMVEAHEPARRPPRMVTATHRLDREGLNCQRHWRDALHEYLLRPAFDGLRVH